MSTFAFIFPGQGSQVVGMLDAWGDHPAVRSTLEEASSALGEDLARLIAQGPSEALELTTNTQPVMLAAAIACWRAWRFEGGAEPQAAAGHSLGEYSALVASGVISLADALPLVRLRAQAMQQAVPVGVGAMAAILGLDAETVCSGCAEIAAGSGEIVAPANFNDPKQIVISGTRTAVDLACEKLKAMGAKRTLPLAVSAPFHCDLMRPAAEQLRLHLAALDVHGPRFAVVNNVDVAVQTDPALIRDALVRQAYSPVRWVEVIQAMRERGIHHFVECGPGRVLAGMVRRIDADLRAISLFDPATLKQAQELIA
jgi:[acyl-carrier-protein] S-malonyltransferase